MVKYLILQKYPLLRNVNVILNHRVAYLIHNGTLKKLGMTKNEWNINDFSSNKCFFMMMTCGFFATEAMNETGRIKHFSSEYNGIISEKG